MRHHGQGRDHPEVHVHQERAGDDDTIGEVVECIADQDRHAAAARLVAIMPVRVVVQVAFVMVRVMQQRQLLEQEEAEDAGQDHPAKR